MSETVLSSTSIASGGTASGTVGLNAHSDELLLEVTEFDANSSNLDFAVTEGAARSDGTVRSLTGGPTSTTGVDVSTSGGFVKLTGASGLARATVEVTNSGASSTTVTVIQHDAR